MADAKDDKDKDKDKDKASPVVTSLTPPTPVPPPGGAAPAGDPEDPKRPDETVPHGAYIHGGRAKGGKHYGGTVRNADGEILAEFKDNEVNDGKPADRPDDPTARPRTLEELRKDKPAAKK